MGPPGLEPGSAGYEPPTVTQVYYEVSPERLQREHRRPAKRNPRPTGRSAMSATLDRCELATAVLFLGQRRSRRAA